MAKPKYEMTDLIIQDNKRFIKLEDGSLKAICGAKRKSDGRPCMSPPMPNGRCRMHGGATPVGIASANFKHGRYSKYMPTRLLERYQQGLNDEELLRLDDEIAVTDVRISELLEDIDLGDSKMAWYELSRQYDAFIAASRANDAQESARAIRKIGELIGQGKKSVRRWEMLFRAFDTRRKLVESERKRRTEMQQMITAEEMNMVLALVQDTIKRYVPSEKLPEVANEFRNILMKE